MVVLKMSFKEKLRMSLQGILGVLSKPKYAVLAGILAFAFACFIFLIINWGLYGSLLFSPLGFADKIATMGLMISQMGREIVTTGNGMLLAIVSTLQGISLSIVTYTLIRNKRGGVGSSKSSLGGSGFAAFAAAIGLGCVPCGTSIAMPIMALFFSGSAYAAVSIASLIVLILALVVTLYSLYKLGYSAFAYTEQDRFKKEST